MNDWLHVTHGNAPLVVSVPHAGTLIPSDLLDRYRSIEIARHDADWHVDQLYAFATDIGATIIHTAISRAVIDVNRDPSGASLYPGQATTGLCPTTTFDGTPLYRDGTEPRPAEIAQRLAHYFDPYHAALAAEITRLRANHAKIVLFDAHSIRSFVPRLFDGQLPQFNIGTNGALSCAPALTRAVESVCAASGDSWVTDGRFRGGWITRHYGRPETGVHAIQLELAMRGYLNEQSGSPPAWDQHRAELLQCVLRSIFSTCIDFAKGSA